MVKKILRVKHNNEEGINSIGGASGITSMLSRGYNSINNAKMSFSDQQESIKRLYKPQLDQIDEPTQAEQDERERLRLEFKQKREEQYQEELAEIEKNKPSQEQVLRQQLNAITFEDI